MRPHPRLTHSDYYRDRSSESELCYDFPGDDIFIDGLHAMQMHFWNNNRNIDIPVVRVMNAAHFIAAYMLQTSCSGDQWEYDTLAYCSVGKDQQLAALTIIVLAAMLKRTDGFRARNCRNLILEERSEDFEEGVTLYERFLRTAEERFAEEDFLIDIPDLATQLREKDELIAQQSQQIATLENTITTMEAQQNNQYIIYQAPVYQGCTFNDSHDTINNYNTKTEDIPSPSSGAPDFSSEIPTREESPKEKPYSPPIPRKGDYNGVRLYIEERKRYDESFKDYCSHHNRKELCTYLTKEFGWFVDDKSLGKNISRNIKACSF